MERRRKNDFNDSVICQEDAGKSWYVRVEDVVSNRIEMPSVDFGDEWYKADTTDTDMP